MSDVLQCPYCSLRFTTRSELDQHKAFDHPREESAASASESTDADPGKEKAKKSGSTEEKDGFMGRLFKKS